jgi:hypothetical protein
MEGNMNTQLEGLVERGNSNRGTVIVGSASPRHRIRRRVWIAAAVALAVLVIAGSSLSFAHPALQEPGFYETAFEEVSTDSLFYLAPSQDRGVDSQGYIATVAALSETVSADNLFYLAPSQVRDVNSQGYAAVIEALSEKSSTGNLFYLAPSQAERADSQEHAAWVAILTRQ